MCEVKRQVLVQGIYHSTTAVVALLSKRYDLVDVRAVFCCAYSEYHTACAMCVAYESGSIQRDVEQFEKDGDVPEYVIGEYFHAAYGG